MEIECICGIEINLGIWLKTKQNTRRRGESTILYKGKKMTRQ